MKENCFVCPIEKTFLEHFWIKEDKGIGFYFNRSSNFIYPVINFIPIFLPYQTNLAKHFIQKNNLLIKERLDSCIFKLPNLKPVKGERSIQSTFSSQWSSVNDSEFTFSYTSEDLIKLHSDVWLYDISKIERENKLNVLNLGCGNGGESIALSRIFTNSTVFAVDLNLNLLKMGKLIKENSNHSVIPIIATLWNLPFKEDYFDHVHCQGVAHHTFSTEKAFGMLDLHTKKDKGSLFLWVYAWEDSHGIKGLRGVAIRIYWFVSHNISRPILSRLSPFLRKIALWIITILYSVVFFASSRKFPKGWKLNDTFHSISDAFSPRFAHQHRWNEVISWFKESQYKEISPQNSSLYKKLFNKRMLGIGFLGKK